MFHVTGVARGTVLYWVIGGTGITARDFSAGALSGQFTVNPNAAGSAMVTIANTLANDLTTEGPETLQIRLFTNAARTLQVGGTVNVTVNDTSRAPAPPPPTYTVSPSVTAVNEGLAVTTTVRTTNVASGTLLYWALTGPGITAADFRVGALTGSGRVAANGRFSFSHTLANDLSTEGPETLQIQLFSDAARTVPVGTTASVVINDTSRSPAPPQPSPPPTYNVTPSLASTNEGAVMTTTVSTTNVAAGTVLYWSLSGTGITAPDFGAGALTGSASVAANGQFSFSHTLANDLITEGPETLQIKLFSDAARTAQVGTTASVVINDTSLTPPPRRTYTITPSATALNEGLLLTTTVSTTNVATGTSLYWRISGTGITSTDFSSASLTGVGTIGSNGQFSFSHQLANDLTTEGNETLLINLYNDSALSELLSSTSVTVFDTSQASGPATMS